MRDSMHRLLKLRLLVGSHCEGVRLGWKRAVPNVVGVFAHCVLHDLANFRVAPRVAKLQVRVEAEQVVEDLHLAITEWTCPNTDRGDAKLVRDLPRHLRHHILEHNRKSTGVLDCPRVVQEGAGHKPTNGLSGATGRASLVGSKPRVGSFGKESEGGTSLRCCGIVKETELGSVCASHSIAPAN